MVFQPKPGLILHSKHRIQDQDQGYRVGGIWVEPESDFYPTPTVHLNNFIHRTAMLGISWRWNDTISTETFIETENSCSVPRFPLSVSFYKIVDSQTSFTLSWGVGEFWKLGFGTEHFTSDSATLTKTTPITQVRHYRPVQHFCARTWLADSTQTTRVRGWDQRNCWTFVFVKCTPWFTIRAVKENTQIRNFNLTYNERSNVKYVSNIISNIQKQWESRMLSQFCHKGETLTRKKLMSELSFEKLHRAHLAMVMLRLLLNK